MAGPPMAPMTSFTGLINCPGTELCLLDQMGNRIANLVSGPETFEALNARAGNGLPQTVTGTILSSPGAVVPRVLVTSVSGPTASPPPTPPPTPPLPTTPPMTTAIELPPSIRNYLDCVGRCLGEKVPGSTAVEILNSVCANTLLAAGQLQPVVGAKAVADLPGWVIALASCVAFTAGFGIGEVLECFLACAPGGRLSSVEIFESRQDTAPAQGGKDGQQGRLVQQALALSKAMATRGVQISPAQVLLLQQAVAVSQAMAARGVQISPAQVLLLMARHQLPQSGSER
jgi:hypothetical protein